LHNPTLRIYLLIIAGILLGAGGLLAILTRRHDVRSVATTYRSWLVMIFVLLSAILLGRIAFILLLTLLAIFALKEFARATGLYRDWWMTGAVYLAIAALGASCLARSPFTGAMGWYGLFMALPVFAIALFLLIPIARDRTAGQLQIMALAVMGFIYIGWMFLHLAFLANSSHPYGYLLYLIVAVELNDVAAFTAGRLLGRAKRHPLRPRISPNKTWEGAIGALCISLALPWIFRFSFPQFGPTQLILTGLIVGIGGQMGDLCISVIKRDVAIKDMGALIPGHGGVLDRIDSLIFTAPLFLHMVRYFGFW
jgi:phosphatidate cytidylyltransferase